MYTDCFEANGVGSVSLRRCWMLRSSGVTVTGDTDNLCFDFHDLEFAMFQTKNFFYMSSKGFKCFERPFQIAMFRSCDVLKLGAEVFFVKLIIHKPSHRRLNNAVPLTFLSSRFMESSKVVTLDFELLAYRRIF